MIGKAILAVLVILFGNPADACAQTMPEATRGELLYSTHCIACHTAQVHWRNNKLVTDWTGLQSQVRRWQAVSTLAWSNEDIAQVARYLNAHYYNFPSQD